MKPVTEMWAYLAENPDEEGIVAAGIPPLGMTPLVFTHKSNADNVRELAFVVGKMTGRRIRLVRLEVVETVETLAVG